MLSFLAEVNFVVDRCVFPFLFATFFCCFLLSPYHIIVNKDAGGDSDYYVDTGIFKRNFQLLQDMDVRS